jgi:hypothetical protein
MEMDVSALARRLMRPDRAGLAEARRVITGLTDARAAWEALAVAEVIGPAWIANPERRFCGALDPASRSKWPTSVPQCLALASDVSGAEEVECLARDVIRALEVWGCPPHTRVAWRYGGYPGSGNGNRYRTTAHAAASSGACVNATLEEQRAWSDEADRLREEVWASYQPGGSHAPLDAGWDVVAAFWWQLADRRRSVVRPELIPRSRAARAALAGRQLRSLRSPFEPLLAIWHLGYAFGEITADDVVLVVPEIE